MIPEDIPSSNLNWVKETIIVCLLSTPWHGYKNQCYDNCNYYSLHYFPSLFNIMKQTATVFLSKPRSRLCNLHLLRRCLKQILSIIASLVPHECHCNDNQDDDNKILFHDIFLQFKYNEDTFTLLYYLCLTFLIHGVKLE